jgi:hypothetical protein
MSQLLFSREVDDVPIHFQIIRLEKQAYVWVATGTPNMSSLHAAMPTKLVRAPSAVWACHRLPSAVALSPQCSSFPSYASQDALPSATTLLPGSDDLQTMAMAQRIGEPPRPLGCSAACYTTATWPPAPAGPACQNQLIDPSPMFFARSEEKRRACCAFSQPARRRRPAAPGGRGGDLQGASGRRWCVTCNKYFK